MISLFKLFQFNADKIAIMNKKIWYLLLILPGMAFAQNKMSPELLLSLGRVSGMGISKDGKQLVYSVGVPDLESNKTNRKTYMMPVEGGTPMEITDPKDLLADKNLSPDKKYLLSHREVKLKKISGSDFYPELKKSNAYIYDDLMYRHWDTWEDGSYDHVFVAPVDNPGAAKDIMDGEPYNTPTKPFGGDEDYIWHPNGKSVIYVTKKKSGKEYAVSTNTDLYSYDLNSGKTENLTPENPGYDLHPLFSSKGVLAWLQMKRDGYESDKQDLIVKGPNGTVNLTADRDDIHVLSFIWSKDGNSIYFNAPINGTIQLFNVAYSGFSGSPVIQQITSGDFDFTGMIGQADDKILVTRTDINHAAEIYSVNPEGGAMTQLTHVNDEIYGKIAPCSTERRFVRTTDKKQMLVWVVYPPDFDPNKKYPTLLYCQGGPQSPLTQF